MRRQLAVERMSSNEGDDVANWPIAIENHFIHLVREEAKKGMKSSTLDKSAWAAIENQLCSKFGIRYPRDKLKSKYNRLRKIYREFTKLLAYPGMIWDPETNTVNASDDVWESYFKKNEFAKRFRRKGCPNYHMLGEIFNTTASGQMHYASTASPPNSDVERDLESEFLSSGAHISLDAEGDTYASTKGHEGTSKTQKRRPLNPPIDLRSKEESKTSKSARVDETIAVWTKSPCAKTNPTLTNIDSIKNKEVSSPFRELGSIEDCMEILEAMEGVDDAAYVRACEKFTNSDWRRMFMKMSDARKRMWLGSLR